MKSVFSRRLPEAKVSTMIRVQQEDFDLAREYQALRADAPMNGAIVTFSGLVRDLNCDEQVTGLFLEHYPGMTEKVLERLVEDARTRWPLMSVRIIHRVGALSIADQIVFVGVSSAHREAAFAACEYLMDFLKTKAPFWKKETRTSGDVWVEAKSSDQERASRWQN